VIEQQRAVASVILYHPRHGVLLQQRDDKPSLRYPGYWTLFGGAVEDGETPDEAIRRELMEELAIKLNPTPYYAYICPTRTIPGEVVTTNHVYYALIPYSTDEMVLHEGQAMQYFDPCAASRLVLAFGQETALRRFMIDRVHEQLEALS
jgi:8-oxo-dGTP pyrophosphatase MutT (NUDIX family)